MKKILRRLLQTIGLVSVVLFCVSAAASFGETNTIVNQTFSEPIKILLLGVGLIGVASYIKLKFN